MPAPTEKRTCKSCGCTEDRACVILVTIAAADGTSHTVVNRGCSWTADDPNLCTGCQAIYTENQNETDILFDLFPVEFNTASHRLEECARQRTGR